MKAPITQTLEWQKLQDNLGERSFFEQGKGYQYLAILKKTPAGNYLYLPYGPVFEKKTGFENALKSIKNLADKHAAVFARVEPQNLEFINHLPSIAKKTKDLNPKETWVLDLAGNDWPEKLPSRLVRYHRNAAKKGLIIEKSTDPADIHYLLDLQKALAKEKGINTFSENYLKTELNQPFATLYLIKESDEVLAAGLVFDSGDTRYNLQGAQSEQGKKLHATGILTIELIYDAVEKGLKTFDFWGIAPEGAPKDHPWAGFTAFKKTFAGEERLYCGAYDLVYDPKKYRLYEFLRRLNRLIRRKI